MAKKTINFQKDVMEPIGQLKEDLEEIDGFVLKKEKRNVEQKWTGNQIDFTTGNELSSGTNIKCELGSNVNLIISESGWYFALAVFDENDEYLGCYDGENFSKKRTDFTEIDLTKITDFSNYRYMLIAHKEGYPKIDKSYGENIKTYNKIVTEKYAPIEITKKINELGKECLEIDNIQNMELAQKERTEIIDIQYGTWGSTTGNWTENANYISTKKVAIQTSDKMMLIPKTYGNKIMFFDDNKFIETVSTENYEGMEKCDIPNDARFAAWIISKKETYDSEYRNITIRYVETYPLLDKLNLLEKERVDNSVEIYAYDFYNNDLQDDEIIENVLEFSKKIENRTIIFDSKNWNISKAILIPENTTMIIDGVTIKQNNGVFDNMFRTDNVIIDDEYPNAYPLQISKCKNVKLIGRNNAKIIACDEPKTSTLSEGIEKPMQGGEWGWRAITALFVYCDNVEVSNIRFEQSHMWTVSFEKCMNGYVHDLDFYTTILNADGVDLRSGCKNFKIENITGFTYDDAVALSCSKYKAYKNEEYPLNDSIIYPSEITRRMNTDLSDDELAIENVQVKNVCTSGACRCVICYSSYGGIVRNVLYDSIENKKTDIEGIDKNHIALFKIYGENYVDNAIKNIRVNNIKCRVGYPVQVLVKTEDVYINKVLCVANKEMDIKYPEGIKITNRIDWIEPE